MSVPDNCTICIEPLATKVATLPCQHNFHVSCIKPWQETANSCPLCRLPIDKDKPIHGLSEGPRSTLELRRELFMQQQMLIFQQETWTCAFCVRQHVELDTLEHCTICCQLLCPGPCRVRHICTPFHFRRPGL